MSVLDWIFVVLLSIALLFLFLSLLFLLFSISNKQKSKELKKKRPKNKVKRKRWIRMRRSLDQKGSTQLKRAILLLLFSFLLAGGGAYSSYYQMMNLSTEDSNTLVQTYFLLDEIEKKLLKIQSGKEVEKNGKQLLELNSALVSYGINIPSIRLTKENQRLLSRYYIKLREYGTNLYGQSSEQLSREDILNSYLNDMKKLKMEEKKIFKQFKVNESALKQKK